MSMDSILRATPVTIISLRKAIQEIGNNAKEANEIHLISLLNQARRVNIYRPALRNRCLR